MPAARWNVDLLLRYAPILRERMRPHNACRDWILALEEVLRIWPLSGVLTSIAEPPHREPRFEHCGLDILYTERFAKHPRAAWLPAGVGFSAVELAWHDAGQDPQLLENLKRHQGANADTDAI